MNMKFLRLLCDRDGITIAGLEKEVGLSVSSIQRWDRTNPRVDSVMKVADYFGVTIDSLVREDEQ